ncbi:MAG: hypothetical protein NVSMB62_28110 [Acidobacteriaceae bacterium]
MPESARQPGLARTGRARDEQILMTLDPLAAGQLLEQAAIETAGGAVVDVLRGCLLTQAGKLQPGGQPLGVALECLTLDQDG